MGFAAVLVDAGVLAATFVQSTDMPGHSVAVVLDQGQRSLGLVDVAVAAAARQACRVGDLTRPVAPVREAASLAHAVDRMVHERARALPVLDEHDEVVGVLTDLDALRWVARRGHR